MALQSVKNCASMPPCEQGYIIFTGVSDIGDFSDILQAPQQISSYRTLFGKKFDVSMLDIENDDEIYCYVYISGKQYIIALVQSGFLIFKKKCQTVLPKKHGRGGQSAPRFGRKAENARSSYVKACNDNLSLVIQTYNSKIIEIFVGGPSFLKLNLINSVIDNNVKKILNRNPFDIATDSELGLDVLISKSREYISSGKMQRQDALLDDLFAKLHDQSVVYTENDTISQLQNGNLHSLFIHDEKYDP